MLENEKNKEKNKVSDNGKGVYFCTKMRLMEFLSNKNFTPFGMMPDKNTPTRVVWLYKASNDLHDAIEEYYGQVPVNR